MRVSSPRWRSASTRTRLGLGRQIERIKQEATNLREHRAGRCDNKPADCSAAQDDYSTLGLKPGATPEQVRAAYRDACRKYHPDHLNGQNVEPHLVELAVQRFKEITAAYQRLKERFPQRQGV